jgi:hypothetical protein
MATLGKQTASRIVRCRHWTRPMPAIPTPANAVLRGRDQGTSPQTEHNAAARAYLQCPHRMLWPRSGLQASALQPHVMEREARSQPTHAHTGPFRLIAARGYGKPADVQPPDHFTMGNRCAASGFCAWGIQPQPGNGTVQYHPGACTPHSLRRRCGPRRSVLSQEPICGF